MGGYPLNGQNPLSSFRQRPLQKNWILEEMMMASPKLQNTKWNFSREKLLLFSTVHTQSILTIPVLSTPEKPGSPWGLLILQKKTQYKPRASLVENSTPMTTYFPEAAQSQCPQRQRWRCRRRGGACLGLTWIKKKSKHSSDDENYDKDDDGDDDRQPKPTKRGLLLVGGRGSQKR